LGQALNNVLLNAAQALESRPPAAGGAPGRARIELRLEEEADGGLSIAVIDNGPGLPGEERERLTEPYVTTRDKGTGLGLAIVKKIMEDHGGDLMLADREGGGAAVKLVFPAAATHAAGPDVERAHGT